MDSRISPPANLVAASHADSEAYEALYRQSLSDPDSFWAEQARRIDWVETPTVAGNWSFDPVDIKWYEDGSSTLLPLRRPSSRISRRPGRDPVLKRRARHRRI